MIFKMKIKGVFKFIFEKVVELYNFFIRRVRRIKFGFGR